MVARIAPSPISTAVTVGDALTHAAESGTPATQAQFQSQPDQHLEPQSQHAAITLAPPAPPPGEAFAAAVISGQLAPRPMTPEQLRQRLGSAWQPPASPLRLMDRSV